MAIQAIPMPRPVSTIQTFPSSGPAPFNARRVDLPSSFRLPSPVGFRIAETASAFWNRSSEDGPDRGNLACAYMVNLVLKQAIGKIYGADPTTVNSVRDDMLRQGGQRVLLQNVMPGDIAFSFNDAALLGVGGATAHIGIFLTPNLIIANSSQARKFNQIITPEQFARLYKYFEIIRPIEATRENSHFSLNA